MVVSFLLEVFSLSIWVIKCKYIFLSMSPSYLACPPVYEDLHDKELLLCPFLTIRVGAAWHEIF